MHRFDIPAVPKKCLLQGLDDVGRTQQFQPEIDAFRARYRKELPFQAMPSAG